MPATSTRGFTVAELIIAIAASGILAGILFGPLDDLYISNSNSIKQIALTTDAHTALRSIQSTVLLSGGFLASNAVTDPTGSSWNYTNGGVNNVLITSNYATTADVPAGSRTLVYNLSDGTTKLQNNYVFFVSNGTLYRRTLKNTTAGTAAIGQNQTCGANYASQSYAASCNGVDATIVKNVSSFTVQYYASAADTATTASPATATTVVLNITLQSGTGTTITASSNLRMSHMN